MNRLAGPVIEIYPLAAAHSLPVAGRLVTDRWRVRTTPAARDPSFWSAPPRVPLLAAERVTDVV
jgi:hypothetical protein